MASSSSPWSTIPSSSSNVHNLGSSSNSFSNPALTSSSNATITTAAQQQGVSKDVLRTLQDVVWSDEEEIPECPLCMEELDPSDVNFKPCVCGYQICRFCHHQIIHDLNGLCPACRRRYDEQEVKFVAVDPEEMKRLQSLKALKLKINKQLETLNRRHLRDVRIVLKNMIYVLGMRFPSSGAGSGSNEDFLSLLRSGEYFGQYGKIGKVWLRKLPGTGTGGGADGHDSSILMTGAAGGRDSTEPTSEDRDKEIAIYITYIRREDAARSISALDGYPSPNNPGKMLKASYGSTKYCLSWLRGVKCEDGNGCFWLHEWAGEGDTFTRADMTTLQHTIKDTSTAMDMQSEKQRLSSGIPTAASLVAPSSSIPIPPSLNRTTSSPGLSGKSTNLTSSSTTTKLSLSSTTMEDDGSALPRTAHWATKPPVAPPASALNLASLPPARRKAKVLSLSSLTKGAQTLIPGSSTNSAAVVGSSSTSTSGLSSGVSGTGTSTPVVKEKPRTIFATPSPAVLAAAIGNRSKSTSGSSSGLTGKEKEGRSPMTVLSRSNTSLAVDKKEKEKEKGTTTATTTNSSSRAQSVEGSPDLGAVADSEVESVPALSISSKKGKKEKKDVMAAVSTIAAEGKSKSGKSSEEEESSDRDKEKKEKKRKVASGKVELEKTPVISATRTLSPVQLEDDDDVTPNIPALQASASSSAETESISPLPSPLPLSPIDGQADGQPAMGYQPSVQTQALMDEVLTRREGSRPVYTIQSPYPDFDDVFECFADGDFEYRLDVKMEVEVDAGWDILGMLLGGIGMDPASAGGLLGSGKGISEEEERRESAGGGSYEGPFDPFMERDGENDEDGVQDSKPEESRRKISRFGFANRPMEDSMDASGYPKPNNPLSAALLGTLGRSFTTPSGQEGTTGSPPVLMDQTPASQSAHSGYFNPMYPVQPSLHPQAQESLTPSSNSAMPYPLGSSSASAAPRGRTNPSGGALPPSGPPGLVPLNQSFPAYQGQSNPTPSGGRSSVPHSLEQQFMAGMHSFQQFQLEGRRANSPTAVSQAIRSAGNRYGNGRDGYGVPPPPPQQPPQQQQDFGFQDPAIMSMRIAGGAGAGGNGGGGPAYPPSPSQQGQAQARPSPSPYSSEPQQQQQHPFDMSLYPNSQQQQQQQQHQAFPQQLIGVGGGGDGMPPNARLLQQLHHQRVPSPGLGRSGARQQQQQQHQGYYPGKVY